jgi:imidazolonepropionase-like amidohydrolase
MSISLRKERSVFRFVWPAVAIIRSPLACSVAALLVAWCLLIDPAAAQSVVFERARVIPGDGSPAIENAAIVVEGGGIARVGPRDRTAIPQGAIRIDLAGKTVMPTIVSTHVHPGFQRGASYSAENYNRKTILDDLNRELYYGVSVAQSLGIEKGDVMFRIRADQAAGKLGGARLLVAGRGIGAPNAGPGLSVYAGIAYEITT